MLNFDKFPQNYFDGPAAESLPRPQWKVQFWDIDSEEWQDAEECELSDSKDEGEDEADELKRRTRGHLKTRVVKA